MRNPWALSALVTVVMAATQPILANESPPGMQIVPSSLLAVDQNRVSIVEGIVGTWKPSLSAAYGSAAPEKEAQLREALMRLRADRLLSASLVGSLDGLATAIKEPAGLLPAHLLGRAGATAQKAIGDANRDLVYTPVTPCRIMDTRSGAAPFNAPLVGPTVRTVTANLSSFLVQGGVNTNCGLPATGMSAIAVVFTVLSPNFDAFLSAGNTSVFNDLSAAVVMNFIAGKPLSNTAIVPLDVSTPATPRFYLTMPPQVSSHTIGDAVGYFSPPTGGGVFAVPNGGTGATSLTSNGVLFGNGAGPILATAPGPNQSILVGTGGAPAFSTSPTVAGSFVAGSVKAQNGNVTAGFDVLMDQDRPTPTLRAPGAHENLRIVRGWGTANTAVGVVNQPLSGVGTGFTYKKLSQGVVEVIFDIPFTAPPAITGNPIAFGAIFCGFSGPGGAINPTATGFTITMWDTSNNGRDWPFDFIAIGPR